MDKLMKYRKNESLSLSHRRNVAQSGETHATGEPRVRSVSDEFGITMGEHHFHSWQR